MLRELLEIVQMHTGTFEQGNLKDHYNLMKIALGPSMRKSAAL